MIRSNSLAKTIIVGLAILLYMLGPAVVLAVSASPASPADILIREQAEHLPTDKVEQFWENLMKEYGGFFPEGQTPGFIEQLVPGNQGFSFSGVMKGLLSYFMHEVLLNGKLMLTIVMLTVFSMILETMQSAFEKSSVSKIAFAITYMVMIVIAINSFSVAIGYAKTAITNMIHFMVAVVPLLMTLLASMGNLATVSILHPLIVFMIHTTGTAIYVVVFPLLFFSVVLHIVSSLSDKYKLTQLANLIRKVSVGVLGFFVTVFLGVVSVQGITGGVTDGVTLRTAKYITGNFIPVVGRLFADASDTVIGASLLVKNAIGLVGVVILVLLCAFPAVKILTLAFIYLLSSAVLQPLGDSPIVSCLQTIGKSMIYIFAAMAVVSLMFFLAITVMITAANVTVMMR
ncbi:stage III sporulation protein AE [Paenibacillus senegalensis]|uniref:stage III sporulation protein AE n=1 Tax=Paenibacillus senegalensis TaxID=1465766 RepID=UPI0002883291